MGLGPREPTGIGIGRLLVLVIVGFLSLLLSLVFAFAAAAALGLGENPLALGVSVLAPFAVMIAIVRFVGQRMEGKKQASKPVLARGQQDSSATSAKGAEHDETYRQTLEFLRKSAAQKPSMLGLWLLSGFALFAFAQGWGATVDLLWLLIVLVFHEGGHFIAMRVFGYEDVKVFLVPFLGAATSGHKLRAPGWQRGIVSLAGPMPGLLLGLVLVFVVPRDSMAWGLVGMLLAINALNLLPLYPLDGGRLVGLILFARAPLLDVLFFALGGVGLVALGFRLDSMILTAFGAALAASTPRRWIVVKAASDFATEMKPELSRLPSELSEASEKALAKLYAAVSQRAAAIHRATRPAPYYAALMRNAYEQALLVPPGSRGSVGLVGLYVLGLMVSVAGFVGFRG